MTERQTYAEHLAAEGGDPEATAPCPCCEMVVAAFMLNATVPEDELPHPWACSTCIQDAARARAVAVPEPVGLTDEAVNGLRAERLAILRRTDWIEFPSSRARHPAAYVDAMDAFRAAVHARFDRAVAEDLAPSEADPWPVEPSASDYPAEPEP